MLALQFATATANLASQNAFLFLATHGPIFIAASSLLTLSGPEGPEPALGTTLGRLSK